jgi:hypothetical protein
MIMVVEQIFRVSKSLLERIFKRQSVEVAQSGSCHFLLAVLTEIFRAEFQTGKQNRF